MASSQNSKMFEYKPYILLINIIFDARVLRTTEIKISGCVVIDIYFHAPCHAYRCSCLVCSYAYFLESGFNFSFVSKLID